MQNDKAKFKNELKKRLYRFTLKLIELLDKLPNDNISKRMADQLIRSGTSIIANYIEGQSASSKKDFRIKHINLEGQKIILNFTM